MTQLTNIYADFKNIEEIVAKGLWAAIKYARGSCVSFTPKKILEYANADSGVTIPVVLTLVKHVLKRLSDMGLLEVDDSRSIVRYRVCKNSRLWEVAKSSNSPDSMFEIVKSVIDLER